MTHYAILLRDLATHGRTTYRELIDRHGEQGYTYGGFVAAVFRARKDGVIVATPKHARGVIVQATHCPCCGRKMKETK